MRASITLGTLLVLIPTAGRGQVPIRPVPSNYVRDSTFDVARPGVPPLSTVPIPTEALHRIQPDGITCVVWTSDTLTPAGDRVYNQDSVSTPPELISAGRREYPEREERAGKGGRVMFRFVIDTLGAPEPCSFSTLIMTNAAFEGPAYRMVLGSKFRPGLQDGHRVPVLAQQSVTFNP